MQRTLSEAAQQLAAAGWRVFPVSAADKRPRTKHGHLDATTDPEQIRAWAWRFDDGGAIATPTGNGLLVIDVDPRNGGKPPHWLPETLTAKTQSGGQHFYYAIDEDIKSRGSMFGRGVDSKCKGGYVLIPPSPGYEWVHVRPKARLWKAAIVQYMNPESTDRQGMARLAPQKWYRGVIHPQAVAWAAYFAAQFDDPEEVRQATWRIVEQAREAGVRIDNARGHIDKAIEWAIQQEANNGPSLD